MRSAKDTALLSLGDWKELAGIRKKSLQNEQILGEDVEGPDLHSIVEASGGEKVFSNFK